MQKNKIQLKFLHINRCEICREYVSLQRIFDLAFDGFGNMKICKILMEERIPITRTQTGTDCDVNYYAWSGSRISTILRNQFYKAYYICQTYNRLGKNACTSHKIEARDLYNLVLADIQEVAAMALKDKEAFYGRLSRRMENSILRIRTV